MKNQIAEPFVSDVYFGDLLAGTDEAGRGPLAGDVVAAAVILDPSRPIAGLADSKKLSEKKREALFVEIQKKALAYGIASASIEEIDEINILHASMLAMSRAVGLLSVKPEHVLVDGNRIPLNLSCSAEAVVKGDARQAAISAASILAKVTRDRDIVEAAKMYPEYGFEHHKGYPTTQHLEALRLHGITPIHRRSFNPVKKMIEG